LAVSEKAWNKVQSSPLFEELVRSEVGQQVNLYSLKMAIGIMRARSINRN
jgi:hypothetical protein